MCIFCEYVIISSKNFDLYSKGFAFVSERLKGIYLEYGEDLDKVPTHKLLDIIDGQQKLIQRLGTGYRFTNWFLSAHHVLCDEFDTEDVDLDLFYVDDDDR